MRIKWFSLNAQPQAEQGGLPFYQDPQSSFGTYHLTPILHAFPDTPFPTPIPEGPSRTWSRTPRPSGGANHGVRPRKPGTQGIGIIRPPLYETLFTGLCSFHYE